MWNGRRCGTRAAIDQPSVRIGEQAGLVKLLAEVRELGLEGGEFLLQCVYCGFEQCDALVAFSCGIDGGVSDRGGW